jgi:hypothetical protein
MMRPIVSAITGFRRRAVFAAVLLTLGFARGSSWASDPTPGPQATCVLSNPAFSGSCTQATPLAPGVTAAAACANVLQCLNDVNCLKTYCNATTVRSGWKLESAK